MALECRECTYSELEEDSNLTVGDTCPECNVGILFSTTDKESDYDEEEFFE